MGRRKNKKNIEKLNLKVRDEWMTGRLIHREVSRWNKNQTDGQTEGWLDE